MYCFVILCDNQEDTFSAETYVSGMFFGGFAFHYLLNIIGFFNERSHLSSDEIYRKWTNEGKNRVAAFALNLLGLLTTHKVYLLLFS